MVGMWRGKIFTETRVIAYEERIARSRYIPNNPLRDFQSNRIGQEFVANDFAPNDLKGILFIGFEQGNRREIRLSRLQSRFENILNDEFQI